MKKSFVVSVLALLFAGIVVGCSRGGGVKGQGSRVEDSEHHESGRSGHRGGHAGHCSRPDDRGPRFWISDGDTITVPHSSRTQHKVRSSGIDARDNRLFFGNVSRQNISSLIFRKSVVVVSADFGVRGLDLAYTLLDDGYHAAILVDTVQRGDAPGTLYVIEPELQQADPHCAKPMSG